MSESLVLRSYIIDYAWAFGFPNNENQQRHTENQWKENPTKQHTISLWIFGHVYLLLFLVPIRFSVLCSFFRSLSLSHSLPNSIRFVCCYFSHWPFSCDIWILPIHSVCTHEPSEISIVICLLWCLYETVTND